MYFFRKVHYEIPKGVQKRDLLNIFSILSLTFYNILGCLKDQITRLDALSKMQSKSWLFEINYFVKNKISAEKSQFFGPILAINLKFSKTMQH